MKRRPLGIIIVAFFAIIAGFGEIIVGVTGNYLGILAERMQPAFSTAVIGAFYSLGGLSLLITRKKWGAALSIAFIGAEILDVCTWLWPVSPRRAGPILSKSSSAAR